MPTYRLGDVVSRVSIDGKLVSVSGKIVAISPGGRTIEYFRSLLSGNGYNQTFIESFLGVMLKRDPDFMDKPVYVIEPETSPGWASFEEAKSIVPGISKREYDFLACLTEFQRTLLWGHRLFIVLDSELV